MMSLSTALRAAVLAAGAALAAPAAFDAVPATAAAETRPMRLEVRFVDRVSGLEAEWGATGQVLLPPAPADAATQQWRDTRAIATSSSRQRVELAPGERAEIRVGRQIPFAGWFLRTARERGWVEPDALWREVESTLDVEAAAAGEHGEVRLALTPEFSFLQGRVRRSVELADVRLEIVLAPGEEARLAPGPAQEDFCARFLAGYDPARRVRPVDMLVKLMPPPEEGL